MYSSLYFIKNGGYSIWIKLFATIKPLNLKKDYNIITEKIGIKFADKPLNPIEKFCNDDMTYLIKGLEIIKDILSQYIDDVGILIEINSIEIFDVQYFQEECLTIAIIKLMSEIYNFEIPNISYHFDENSYKYIYEF